MIEQHHHAWVGDWGLRIMSAVRARGCKRVTEYARSRPVATLCQLAADLGLENAAPIQLQWMMSDEASDADALEYFAKDMLVRYLHELPGGWPDRDIDDVEDKLIAWQGCLHRHGEEAILERMSQALVEYDVPKGWLPKNIDDPLIVMLFRDYWPRP